LAGAEERPETYTILVSKPGHETWSIAGILVSDDECGVVTKKVRVELTPME